MTLLSSLLFFPRQDVCLELYACSGCSSWEYKIVWVQRVFCIGVQPTVSTVTVGLLTQSNAMAILYVFYLVYSS